MRLCDRLSCAQRLGVRDGASAQVIEMGGGQAAAIRRAQAHTVA